MARLWLAGLGVRDAERGFRDLRDLAARGLPLRLVALLAEQLDLGLASLPRSGHGADEPGAVRRRQPRRRRPRSRPWPTNPRSAEIAVQLFSTSQFFSELMIRDPALLDWLRGGADRRDRETLIDDLWAELDAAPTEDARRLALRRFRLREILRIGYNDIVRDLPLELITLDLSHLADACVEVAYRLARRNAEARHGTPSGSRRPGRPVRRPGAGQARRRGAELQLGHRPDLPLRRRRPDRRPEAGLQRRVLRQARRRGRPVPLRPHQPRPGLPGRHEAPARGGPGAARAEPALDPRLLPDRRPDLGAAGPDQVPADRRRPRPRPRLPRGDHAVRLSDGT